MTSICHILSYVLSKFNRDKKMCKQYTLLIKFLRKSNLKKIRYYKADWRLVRVKIKEKTNEWQRSIVNALPTFQAHAWKQIYHIKNRLQITWVKRWYTIFLSILFIMMISTFYASSKFNVLPDYFNDKKVETLKDYFIALGATMIGAGAISFSFIMFASQINIERMPHRLFGRFNSDKKILGAFISIFITAIIIASFSIIVSERLALSLTIITFWLMIISIVLIMYAYQRTIILINPIKQLTYVIDDITKHMQSWGKGANRLKVLYTNVQPNEHIQNDIQLTTFFQGNPHWTNLAKETIDTASSYIRRYAEYGDYIVVKNAFNVIIQTNILYIQTKGKTFFSDSLFVDNPLSTDGFINYTLEEVKRSFLIGVSKQDEVLIEKSLEALSALSLLYCNINYSSEYAGKFHAKLALAYLVDSLKQSASKGMTDVVMRGLRLMRDVGIELLKKSKSEDVISLLNDMMIISAMGIPKSQDRPITLVGIKQISYITMYLLHIDIHNSDYLLKRIHEIISSLAQAILTISDKQDVQVHNYYLAPYYSGTDLNALPAMLNQLVNALLEAKADDTRAKTCIRNFASWTGDMHQTEKETLVTAIEARSHFTFDILNYIEIICQLMLALRNSDACDNQSKKYLEDNAIGLLAAYTWIPRDAQTLKFIGGYKIEDKLFELIFEAGTREASIFFNHAFDQLNNWAIQAGKYRTGWATLEMSIFGLVSLVIIFGENHTIEGQTLEQRFLLKLRTIETDTDHRRSVIRNINTKLNSLYTRGYWHSSIETSLSQQDREKVKSLLQKVINELS